MSELEIQRRKEYKENITACRNRAKLGRERREEGIESSAARITAGGDPFAIKAGIVLHISDECMPLPEYILLSPPQK